MAVKHHAVTQDNDENNQYEVSVKVETILYTVLYTAPPGSNVVEYRVGLSGPVMIEQGMLAVNDLMGRTNKLPILRSEVIHEDSTP